MDRRPTKTTSAANRLAAALDALAGMDAAALARRWRQLWRSAPPPGLSLALQARVIAYRLQALAHGDLDRATAQALDRLVQGQRGPSRSDQDRGRRGRGGGAPILVPIPDRRGHTPGVVLSREWAGVMHTVRVLEAGYAWNGAIYDSLSRVAHAITGTKWNGPRFFGLRAAPRTVRQLGAHEGGRRP